MAPAKDGTACVSSAPDLVRRVRAEYLEMPGLRLTAAQVERLCGIDGATCTQVLESLVRSNFLCLKQDKWYARPID